MYGSTGCEVVWVGSLASAALWRLELLGESSEPIARARKNATNIALNSTCQPARARYAMQPRPRRHSVHGNSVSTRSRARSRWRAAPASGYCTQRSERWMYRSAGPNWRIQVNSSGDMYLSGKRCNTILKFRTSGTRYSSRRLRVPLVRKHSQFSSLSSVTLFWRQKLN